MFQQIWEQCMMLRCCALTWSPVCVCCCLNRSLLRYPRVSVNTEAASSTEVRLIFCTVFSISWLLTSRIVMILTFTPQHETANQMILIKHAQMWRAYWDVGDVLERWHLTGICLISLPVSAQPRSRPRLMWAGRSLVVRVYPSSKSMLRVCRLARWLADAAWTDVCLYDVTCPLTYILLIEKCVKYWLHIGSVLWIYYFIPKFLKFHWRENVTGVFIEC